jgi:hypothetical protein
VGGTGKGRLDGFCCFSAPEADAGFLLGFEAGVEAAACAALGVAGCFPLAAEDAVVVSLGASVVEGAVMSTGAEDME